MKVQLNCRRARLARHFNCPSNPKTLLFQIYYLPPKAHRRPVNRHMEVKRDGERQIVALWILSTDSIHFVSSTVFRLFWSSDNCAVNGAKGLQMAAERERNSEIYCRQLWSNFGRPSNVSYQYAIVFRFAPLFVWIPPELLFCYFSIRRRVSRKLNMKINFLCAALFIFYYETFIVKTDFKFIIGVSAE